MARNTTIVVAVETDMDEGRFGDRFGRNLNMRPYGYGTPWFDKSILPRGPMTPPAQAANSVAIAPKGDVMMCKRLELELVSPHVASSPGAQKGDCLNPLILRHAVVSSQ